MSGRKNIGLVLPAAGHSSRMGRCKFLMPMLDGKPFIYHIVKSFSSITDHIVIVTRRKYLKAIKMYLADFKDGKIKYVCNHFPEKERFYSLQLGLHALPPVYSCFIHNADSPFVNPEILRSMLMKDPAVDYIIPVHRGRGGHPILVTAAIVEYLKQLPEESNLHEALKFKRSERMEVNDNSVLIDIDTMPEYEHYVLKLN